MKYFPRVVFIIASSIFFCLVISNRVFADNQVSINTLQGPNITLDPSITYLVVGEQVIPAGSTLTIPAGTHLVFTPGSYLVILGTLLSNGTAANHVSIVGGPAAPVIPQADPVIVPEAVTQSPQIQNPETQSTEVQSLAVSMTDNIPVTIGSHSGFLFEGSTTSTLSYTDITGANYGISVYSKATVIDSHPTFTDCDIGIMGFGGSVTLTDATFNTVTQPAEWDFHGSFTHSGSTFINTGVKGWSYDGPVESGETMKLDSTDGDYGLTYVTINKGGHLIINPGVKVFIKDGNGFAIYGALNASGTAADPITIYGDGVCTTHEPVFTFNNTTVAIIGHVNFNDLCSGIAATNSTITMTNDSFDTIAATAVHGIETAIINASDITMNDIYQAFDVDTEGHLVLSNTTITLVNGTVPAINISTDTPFSANTVSIDHAATCMGILENSSINATQVTLNHCYAVGLLSTNSGDSDSPSGITLTDSEIMNSGTAMKLTNADILNVSNDKFHDNIVGISLTDMPSTTIINNWWGSSSGPTIDSNPGGTGDSIIAKNVPNVTYRPWLGLAAVEHNPIIIVPGITGSRLNKQYSDRNEIWPSIAQLILSPSDNFLDDLELTDSGMSVSDRPIAVGDIIRSVSSTDVFDSMIAALIKDGYSEGTNLFVLPYDWRLSNTANQSLLKDAIANALARSGKTKVNIMAHSMGGLLVKDYLAQNPTAPIDHLFYIGVPHLGAPKAFQTLMYGDTMGFAFSVAGINIPFLNAGTVKTISQNMPSVYELLPSQKYIDAVGSYVTDLTQSAVSLTLDAIEKLMTTSGRNAQMFSFAKTLHDTTDSFDQSKFSAYDFIGCGATKTIGGYTLTKEQSLTLTGLKIIPEHHIYYVSGDGVVPSKSANAANGALNYYITSGSHGTLPSVSQIQNAITDVLDGKFIETNGAGISDDMKNCALSGKVVEVHSPVTLDIYDDQDRHTGPAADGEIEYGIPNVDYEMIGDEKFAFLPDGIDYKVVNRAQSVGTYDMYINDSSNSDAVTLEEYFSQIPVTTADTVGTIIVGPSDPAYELDVDEKGDGSISKFYPAGSDQPSYINDRTPPLTNAVVAGDAVLLFAHDESNGSGVYNTKYSIDNGITWNIYKDPFDVSAGTTVEFVSLDRAGNTEDIKQIVVPALSVAQTTEVAPVTIDPTPTNTTYNYDSTTITQPPATSNDDPTDQPEDEQAMQPDSPIEQTPETGIQTPNTATPLVEPSAPANSATAIVSDAATQIIPAINKIKAFFKKSVQQKTQLHPKLLASVQAAVISNKIAYAGSILLAAILLLFFLAKKALKKKNKDRSE